jgi:hypothetical protein
MIEKEGAPALTLSGWYRPLMLLVVASATVSYADRQLLAQQTVQLKVIEVNEPEGQILSYRHLAGSTEVHMRGTRLAPTPRSNSRSAAVRASSSWTSTAGISGLEPAHRLGRTS